MYAVVIYVHRYRNTSAYDFKRYGIFAGKIAHSLQVTKKETKEMGKTMTHYKCWFIDNAEHNFKINKVKKNAFSHIEVDEVIKTTNMVLDNSYFNMDLSTRISFNGHCSNMVDDTHPSDECFKETPIHEWVDQLLNSYGYRADGENGDNEENKENGESGESGSPNGEDAPVYHDVTDEQPDSHGVPKTDTVSNGVAAGPNTENAFNGVTEEPDSHGAPKTDTVSNGVAAGPNTENAFNGVTEEPDSHGAPKTDTVSNGVTAGPNTENAFKGVTEEPDSHGAPKTDTVSNGVAVGPNTENAFKGVTEEPNSHGAPKTDTVSNGVAEESSSHVAPKTDRASNGVAAGPNTDHTVGATTSCYAVVPIQSQTLSNTVVMDLYRNLMENPQQIIDVLHQNTETIHTTNSKVIKQKRENSQRTFVDLLIC